MKRWCSAPASRAACLFGVPLAWAISRTDMPAKNFIRLMVFGAFIIPPYLGAIGWILLAGPNSGWLNKVWMAATGAEHGIFNIYSMAGLIVVIAVTSFPYVFVFTNSALDLVSSEMEDAANILGAGTLRTTFRVTLPLVLPAIVGGLIISFLEAIALFGAPALIALRRDPRWCRRSSGSSSNTRSGSSRRRPTRCRCCSSRC